MAGIESKSLSEITIQDKHVLIVGLIIGKTEPNIFISKHTEEFCGVMTLTIRDSKKYFTNLKIWLNKEKIDEINQKYHLYDIIDIICPKLMHISSRSINEQQFEPNISLTYSLMITEESGCIEPHLRIRNSKINSIQELENEPLKSLTTILNLADINSSGLQSSGQFVDLLVAVRLIKPIRNIKSKTGSMLQCLELIVIDKSFLTGISLTIWNREWIRRITDYWAPLNTVLHLIDVRVGFSTFYKKAVLALSNRSLIVENPTVKETNQLIHFIQNTELPDSDILNITSFDLPNAESITTIMTVQQIYDRLIGHLKDDGIDQFTAVLYAMITKFDLDGYSNIIAKKCKNCKKRLKQSDLICLNDICQMQFSFDHSGHKFDQFFDINVHLTDHTGTLLESRLSNNVAEEILNISIENFVNLQSEEVTKLKWKFLMQRFEVKLLMKKKSLIRYNNYVILISLQSISLDDAANKILVY